MTDHNHVCRCLEAMRGVDKEPEPPPFGELPDGADDGGAGWYAQSISPKGSVSRLKAVFERRWQSDCRKVGYSTAEIVFESGVGAQGPNQPPIKKVVIGIASDVAGAAERTDQRGRSMNSRGHAQEMVVGEMADDDVALVRQRCRRSEI